MSAIRVLDIIAGTTVDGVGLRTSIYVAGCRHQCEGCHNRQSWDFDAGVPMSVDEIMERVEEEDFNVTLTGGDPMWQAEKMLPLAQAIKAKGYTLWCYTGFVWEQIVKSPEQSALLEYIDVLVDGKFVASERDVSLRFKGSGNQRIIDVKKTMASGKIEIWG